MKKANVIKIFILILTGLYLTSCKNEQTTVKIYQQYIAEGFVEISSQNSISRYQFSEKRYDRICSVELQKGKNKIKMEKKDGQITLDGKPIKNVAEDVFLEYYIDKLMNAEKYTMVKQKKDTVITVELKGDIRYLHYYFTDSKLKKIDVIYQDERFKKTIYLTRYDKL